MKTLRAFLVILTISLMSSCASFQLVTDTPQVTYSFGYYDYNTIHSLYLTNPYYFYDNFYLDQYGVRQYYYNHPYFVRYCNARNIRPNHHYYINNHKHKKSYVNNRRETPTRRVINNSAIRQQNSAARRTTTPTVRRMTPINNNYTTRRNNVSTPIKHKVNRSSTPRANIRPAPKANSRTNSVRRRN